MTGKHYRWQLDWRVDRLDHDPDRATLQHADGVRAHVGPRGASPTPDHATDFDAAGRAWRLTIDNPRRILDPRPDMRDPASRRARLQRLQAEAVAMWRHAVDPRGRFPTLKPDA